MKDQKAELAIAHSDGFDSEYWKLTTERADENIKLSISENGEITSIELSKVESLQLMKALESFICTFK